MGTNNAASVSVRVLENDVAVTKTVDDPTPPLGGLVTYTIRVTNNGPDTAEVMDVFDVATSGSTEFVSATATANGASVTLEVVATVTQAGTLTNLATKTAQGEDDPVSTNNSSGATLNGQAADIQVLKVVDQTTPPVGQPVMFTVTVSNNGPSAATGVEVTDLLPAGLTFVRATTLKGTYTDGTGVWDIGALASSGAEATAILQIVAQVETPGTLHNTATSTQVDQTDTNPTNNSSSVTVTGQVVADLAITKTTDMPGVIPGAPVTYTIAVTNSGPSAVTGAPVMDTVPATLIDVTWTCTASGDSTCPASDKVTITFVVVVNTPLPGTVTQVANQGLVTGVGVPGVLSNDPDTLQIADATLTPLELRPLLHAVKRDALQLDADADGVTAGDTLRYTVTLTNTGTAEATKVVFTDTPGHGTALVAGTVERSAGTITSGNAPGDTTVTVDVGTLAPGAEVIITFDVHIDPALPPRVDTVTNQGRVISAENPAGELTDDPDTSTVDDATETSIQGRPRLEAVKAAVLQRDADDDGLAGAGDTIQYVITVTNVGTAPATAVRFTDTPDANTVLVAGSVQAPQGAVMRGNAPGDTDVEVLFPTLADEEHVSLSFRVTITAPLPADVEHIANQGMVDAVELPPVLTDDPTTVAEDDSTETSLAGTGRIGDLVWHDLDGDGGRTTGEPGLDGVTVMLTEAGPDGRLDTADDIPFAAQTTDANGTYAFTALRRGAYRVKVDAATVPPGSALTTDNVPLIVALDAGAVVEDADFGYQQQGRVSGHLFNDRHADGCNSPASLIWLA